MNLQGLKEARILVVDDCRVSSLCIKQLLKHLLIDDVDTANSHEKATSMCAKKSYNILIVDYHLEQDINGLELFTLLKKDKKISLSCSLIILSGDSTTQTVMGVLSTGVGSYMCKPVSKKIIKDKVSAAFNSYKLLEKVYLALAQKQIKKGITLAVDYCIKNRGENEIELFIIRYLEENNQISALLKLCEHPEFKKRNNFIFANIKNKYKKGGVSAEVTISELNRLIESHLLYIAAYDLLSDIYLQMLDYENSLKFAIKAINLTPSISFRSVKAARIASWAKEPQALCSAGLLLAKNLTVSEEHWSGYIAEFFVHFEVLYQKPINQADKARLMSFLDVFSTHCRRKLLQTQEVEFNLLFTIFQCRLMIVDGDVYNAKEKLFKCFSVYGPKIANLNSVVITDLIALYYFFGESDLFISYYEKLQSRTKLNIYSASSWLLYTEREDILKNMMYLKGLLEKARVERLKNENYESLKQSYQKILNKYPYNTEACLGYLACHLKLSSDKIPELVGSVASISRLILTGELKVQQKNILNQLHYNEEIILQEINSPSIIKGELIKIEQKANFLQRGLSK